MENSFFDALYDDMAFTRALGKMVLSSARFETAIKSFVDKSGKVDCGEKSPLGRRLKLLVENHEIDRTAVEQFSVLLHERNYFVHRLHANLSEYPDNPEERKRFINRVRSISAEMNLFSWALERQPPQNEKNL